MRNLGPARVQEGAPFESPVSTTQTHHTFNSKIYHYCDEHKACEVVPSDCDNWPRRMKECLRRSLIKYGSWQCSLCHAPQAWRWLCAPAAPRHTCRRPTGDKAAPGTPQPSPTGDRAARNASQQPKQAFHALHHAPHQLLTRPAALLVISQGCRVPQYAHHLPRPPQDIEHRQIRAKILHVGLSARGSKLLRSFD